MTSFLVLITFPVADLAFADTLPIVERAQLPAATGEAPASGAPGDLRGHHVQR